MRLDSPLLAAAITLLAAAPPAVVPAAPPATAALVVKASAVARPCVLAAAAALGSAGPVTVQAADIGAVDSAGGADVVVAAEEELTRVIEGGASKPDVEAELGRIPWVLVAPAGSPAPDVRSLGRSTGAVRVPRGVVARHARESLEGIPPERVRSVLADAVAPRPGELALVPLSLAGRGSVSATDVPPVVVVAVGVRASARPDAARAFVEALASGPGNAAFRACGREASR